MHLVTKIGWSPLQQRKTTRRALWLDFVGGQLKLVVKFGASMIKSFGHQRVDDGGNLCIGFVEHQTASEILDGIFVVIESGIVASVRHDSHKACEIVITKLKGLK